MSVVRSGEEMFVLRGMCGGYPYPEVKMALAEVLAVLEAEAREERMRAKLLRVRVPKK